MIKLLFSLSVLCVVATGKKDIELHNLFIRGKKEIEENSHRYRDHAVRFVMLGGFRF